MKLARLAPEWRPGDGALVDARSYASAILNILEDSADEKLRLGETQRAVLNILDDFADEQGRLGDTQRAILNILEDDADERFRLEATQKAVLNILDDSAREQDRLADTQRAVLNILDDFDIEKSRVAKINDELRNEIAERERAEEALRKASAATEAANRELEAFSYSVAHDLRAPLRSMDGFSQALLEDYSDSLDEQAKTYLRYVRESAQHMARLINDLLALARVSQAALHRSPLDLSDLARTTIARLTREQPDRTVEFVLPAELSAVGDPTLLEVVLENLLGNAWKFTGKQARARIELGWNGAAYFIRDDGAGFDMAYAEKLFAVFQRLHKVSEFEGVGVGLATVDRIVRRHGGRIWAEGEVGRGATFYFTLQEEAR
jgi:signal transduction histidine kinase